MNIDSSFNRLANHPITNTSTHTRQKRENYDSLHEPGAVAEQYLIN